jgi:HEAT repeat protein
MIDIGMEFAKTRDAVRGNWALRSGRSYLQPCLGAFIALAGCGVLAMVWQVAADENRRQMIAAVRALEQARTSAQRVEAIQDLVRPLEIDARLAIPPLTRSLNDPAVPVRIAAARSLGCAISAAAVAGTANELVTTAIGVLVSSLDDPEPTVRIAAAFTLGSIAASKDPSGIIHPQSLVDALALLLDDPDATVRASTIAALGVAAPAAAPEPPPALIAALDDQSSFNRAAAAHALTRFPGSKIAHHEIVNQKSQ